jgi:hypothetical protein
VNDALPFVKGPARESLKLFQLLEEGMVVYWGVDLHVLLLFSLDVKVNTCLNFCPLAEARILFSTEWISAT